MAKFETPQQDFEAMGQQLLGLWQALAHTAPSIAHARRTVFLAYVAEGFTEQQALELIKGT